LDVTQLNKLGAKTVIDKPVLNALVQYKKE